MSTDQQPLRELRPISQHLLGFWRDRPTEARLLLGMCALFALIFFLPVGQARFENAVLEGLRLTRWYAREHVILCLLPAFVIAGAMAVVTGVLFLLALLLIPVGTVFVTAFRDGDGSFESPAGAGEYEFCLDGDTNCLSTNAEATSISTSGAR